MALGLRMVRAGGFADVPTSDCHGTRSTNGKGWWVSMVFGTDGSDCFRVAKRFVEEWLKK